MWYVENGPWDLSVSPAGRALALRAAKLGFLPGIPCSSPEPHQERCLVRLPCVVQKPKILKELKREMNLCEQRGKVAVGGG